MLGRLTLPRRARQLVPLLLGFLLGYSMRSLDRREEESPSPHGPPVEQESPLFRGRATTLLVLVISSPANSQQRDVIRQTWLSLSRKNHDYQAFFVIGSRGLNSKQEYDINLEKSLHNDLISLPIQDAYGDLTKKVLKSMEFSEKNYRFDYLLKADDDTMVDIEKVLKELKTMNDPLLYWGFFDGRAPVQTKGKWADPLYRLCDRYIPYALGGGYVLGKDIVEFIADNARLLELYNSEDASVGSWLAGLKVNRRHDPRFDTEWKSRGCSNKFLVTHKQTQADMKIKWARLTKYGNLCEGAETKVRLSYNYDWSRPPSECCIRSDHHQP